MVGAMRRWLRYRLALPFLQKASRLQNEALWAFETHPVDTTGHALGELNWAVGGLYQSVGVAIAGDIDV